MQLAEYEYKGLLAEAWDVLRGDTSQWPDRFFYRALIERFGQPVLDVGCGTGRLLLDYLAQGIDIDGVDNSPDMLALCRKKADHLGLDPALYEQYLETLALPRRYRTILVPSSTLQLILELERVQQALQRLHDHLLPGGALAASMMILWNPGDPLVTEWEKSAVRQEDGAMFHRMARSVYNPDTECEDTEDRYQLIREGHIVAEEIHRRAPATRSYTVVQARALFENAGFHPVSVYSEFTFEPVRATDTLFTVVGEKR